MFLIKIKAQKIGEQHLLLRQTKDSSLISAKLLQFKEEKNRTKRKSPLWRYRGKAGQKLDQRVTGRCGNSTVVLPVLGHSDVALVSPVRTPAAGAQDTRSVCCQSSHKSTSLSNQWPFSFLLCSLADSPVLHNPVVLSVLVNALVSVTHQQHAVVQLLTAAVLVIVDSWRAQDLIRPQT